MDRKTEKRELFDRLAPERDHWRRKNACYHAELEKLFRFIVPENSTVLEIGCGTGELLNSLKPKIGVGIDISPRMIEVAQGKFPHLRFSVGEAENLKEKNRYDYIIMSDLLGELDDVVRAFRALKNVTTRKTRVVINYYNYLWEAPIRIAEKKGLKMPSGYQHWLSLGDIENLLYLSGYEVVKKGYRTLAPVHIPVLSGLINTYVAIMPVIRKLCLVQYIVAKEMPAAGAETKKDYSVSVVIPCRNERGNIRAAVERTPDMGSHTEIIFVDGHSTDGTVEAIEEMIDRERGRKDIKLLHQIPRPDEQGGISADHEQPPNKMLKLGKGDAVRKGFAAAGDILMILDSDLTIPPESLPLFYAAIASEKGELINGSRLVYQMEKQAMRTLNILGNKFFSIVFTWLLEQRVKDTLCGTKVLFREDYEKIVTNRAYFGDFDPFGDFDLLFGAAKQSLKIVELPIRYRERTYGEIKIERFKHGVLLVRMSLIALRKLKFLS